MSTNERFPSINSFGSRKAWEEACWKKLIAMPTLLQNVVTDRERHAFVLRVMALTLLRSGKGFRAISRELQLSRQTLSAVKKAAQNSDYQSYRSRSKMERVRRRFSRNTTSRPPIHEGRAVKTKYGKVWLP